jgi:tubulin-specific chaperone D
VRQIFRSLGHLPQGVLRKYGNELILAALCQVIANSLSLQALQLPNSESLWKPPIDQSLKHREAVVQEAAAEAMTALSKLILCDQHVKI